MGQITQAKRRYGQSCKILCVEDDPADREAIRDYCYILGYQVDFAHTSAAGLNLSNSAVYDVIVVDINLPDYSGLELIKQIRMPEHHNAVTPIVIYSNGTSETIKIIARAFGVKIVIAKPLLLSAFEMVIKRAQRNIAANQPNDANAYRAVSGF